VALVDFDKPRRTRSAVKSHQIRSPILFIGTRCARRRPEAGRVLMDRPGVHVTACAHQTARPLEKRQVIPQLREGWGTDTVRQRCGRSDRQTAFGAGAGRRLLFGSGDYAGPAGEVEVHWYGGRET